MKFSEFIIDNPTAWNSYMSDFAHLKKFLENNFANFNMLLDSTTFYNKLSALLLNNILELRLSESIIDEWESKKLTTDKFGTIGETISNATGNNVNSGAMSYGGYNADGDYQKNNSTGNQTSNATTKTSNLNYFEFFKDINNAKYYNTWKDFETQFFRLFQRYYI
ncbi:MAG: hypothetical protein RSD51_03310 [Malacoplasma sp.]